jgi:hypothetical protein
MSSARPLSFQYDVEAASTTVAPMRPAHRSDRISMARSGKPIVHCRTDLAALDWRVTSAVMAGDQQQYPIAARDRLVEAAVDRRPGHVESHSMQVKDAIGIDPPAR